MKCYEVTEPVEGNVNPGILIDPSREVPGITLGRGEQEKILPLGVSQKRRLEEAIRRGYLRPNLLVPLVRSDVIDEVASKQKEGDWLPCGETRVRLCKEKDYRDLTALVYVEIPTIEGEVQLFANTYKEEIRNNWVQRIYLPIEEAVGVEVVAKADVEMDGSKWPDALIKMRPGSTFRVHRSGKLEGETPEILVTWSGTKLRTIVPAKYRRSES